MFPTKLLRAMELPISMSLGRSDVREWDPGALEALAIAGILIRTRDAVEIPCPHSECKKIHTVKLNQAGHSYINCRRYGSVDIPPDELVLWSISVDGLARSIAVSLGCSVPPSDHACPGRLWYCGSALLHGILTNVYLARGTSWKDAPTVFNHSVLKDALVLTICPEPPLVLAAARCFPILPMISVHGGHLIINVPNTGQTTAVASASQFQHSADFAVVIINGRRFELNVNQAKVVEALWLAYVNGTPHLHADYLVDTILGGTSFTRIRDVFRSLEDWTFLLCSVSRPRGHWRLNL